jgi:hypothetical protein
MHVLTQTSPFFLQTAALPMREALQSPTKAVQTRPKKALGWAQV